MKPNRNKTVTWHSSNLPFETNYHFETPFQAYLDIKPVIDWLCTSQLKTEKHTVRLYDPYYCNGKTAKQLKDLGYDNILHEKRDFYKDISNDTVPAHDIFITNPPFSDSHKTQCLSYCFQKLREPFESPDENNKKAIPFLLLMPAYVAAKQYYREFLSKEPESVNDMVYLIPSTTYKYNHPENTGKDDCPFNSLWFFGLAKNHINSFQNYMDSLPLESRRLTLATSLAQLQNLEVITSNNRPNPKQRRRVRKRINKDLSNENTLTSPCITKYDSKQSVGHCMHSKICSEPNQEKKRKKRY
jgi:hypothetical protein